MPDTSLCVEHLPSSRTDSAKPSHLSAEQKQQERSTIHVCTSFSQRVVNRWNSLSQEDVDAYCINCFNSRLEKRRARQMDFFKDL